MPSDDFHRGEVIDQKVFIFVRSVFGIEDDASLPPPDRQNRLDASKKKVSRLLDDGHVVR